MRFAVIAALVLLSACQPLPHPFADDRPSPNAPILTPPDSAGVVVMPVSGAPEPASHDLASAMATALQDQDVPASTEASNKHSYRLQGAATTQEIGGGNLSVTIAWEMREADGTVRSSQQTTQVLSQAAWKQGGTGISEIALGFCRSENACRTSEASRILLCGAMSRIISPGEEPYPR